MTILGGHFSDLVVSKIKEGKVFRGTGDNWDLKILKGNVQKDIKNEDLHMFASNLIENRLNFTHLSYICMPCFMSKISCMQQSEIQILQPFFSSY